MTAVASRRYRAPLRARMAAGYRAAELFALEAWCDAKLTVEHHADDVREHGASAAHGRALMNAGLWETEAERCGLVAGALEAMG